MGLCVIGLTERTQLFAFNDLDINESAKAYFVSHLFKIYYNNSIKFT